VDVRRHAIPGDDRADELPVDPNPDRDADVARRHERGPGRAERELSGRDRLVEDLERGRDRTVGPRDEALRDAVRDRRDARARDDLRLLRARGEREAEDRQRDEERERAAERHWDQPTFIWTAVDNI
jgi:hypothetical protein